MTPDNSEHPDKPEPQKTQKRGSDPFPPPADPGIPKQAKNRFQEPGPQNPLAPSLPTHPDPPDPLASALHFFQAGAPLAHASKLACFVLGWPRRRPLPQRAAVMSLSYSHRAD